MMDLLITLLVLAICVVLGIGPLMYGIVLAFKASIILGIFVLIVEPLPLILGWASLLYSPDLCDKLAAWLHLPF